MVYKIKSIYDTFNDTMETCKSILRAKNNDYASKQDPYANFRASDIINIPPAKGILMRTLDKIARINTFIEDGKLKVKGESVDDAIHDIINYMVLLKGLINEANSEHTGLYTNHIDFSVGESPIQKEFTSDSTLDRTNLSI